MAAHTSAELVVFDGNLHEGGLDEFLPEEQRGGPLWPGVQGSRAKSRSWPLVLPVVIAAAIAGGALSWAGVGSRARPVPSVPRSAPAVAPAAADAVAPPVPEPLVEIAPPATRTATVAAPAPVDPGFERTLAAVSQSYRSLDAAALTAVWPGADTAVLGERFSALKYQSLTFDRCQVTPNGAAGALASCDVSIASALKAGEPSLQRRRESWALVMDRSGGRWTIAGVSVR